MSNKCQSCLNKSMTYKHPQIDCNKKRDVPFFVRHIKSGQIYVKEIAEFINKFDVAEDIK